MTTETKPVPTADYTALMLKRYPTGKPKHDRIEKIDIPGFGTVEMVVTSDMPTGTVSIVSDGVCMAQIIHIT